MDVTPWTIAIIAPPEYPHWRAFSDVAIALRAALCDLGHPACISHPPAHGWGPDDGRLLVLGANILPTHWGRDIRLPPHAIIYNLEQAGTTWFGEDYIALLRRHKVWDYDHSNALRLMDYGINVSVCPLGYHPVLSRIRLSPDPDISILFYGSITDRRGHLIRSLAMEDVHVTCAFNCYGEKRDALIARAKIVLNLHAWEHSPLETCRLQLLWANKVCVLQEVPDFKMLVALAKEWLASPALRKDIGEYDHQQFRRHAQADYLRPLIGSLTGA